MTASSPSQPLETRPAATSQKHSLTAENLRLAYGDRVVVDALDFVVPTDQVTVIVGANACGKSTLLRALARLIRLRQGTVLLDGADIARLPTRQVATRLGILPQQPTAPGGITVADLVARGRHPHQKLLRAFTAADRAAIDGALTATRTAELADRAVDELSGGQRQRVWIALALAQQTPLLLLDEPTTFLDLAHQIDVLDLVAELNQAKGRTVVMVLHDLNLACRYADHLVAMKAGAIVAQGPPSDVITPQLLGEVFGLSAQVIDDPATHTPLIIPAASNVRHTDAPEPVAGRLPALSQSPYPTPGPS